MNILTFDIEEWYIEKVFGSNSKDKYEIYDRLLNLILENLEERNIKATFFCLGKMATTFPYVISKIASLGHEIGCHSNTHSWVNKMTATEFREDTKAAIHSIEDLLGEKVLSYRAPAFSIGENNKWAFEILTEFGINNDASVFPGIRDFGGFPSFIKTEPTRIKYQNITIVEFPVQLGKIPLINTKLAFSGGGYFRLLPYSLVKKMMNSHSYNMFYFHIGDFDNEKIKFLSKRDFEDYFKEKGTVTKRVSRYLKSNIGRKSTLKNLLSLINNYDFCSIKSYIDSNPLLHEIEI